VRARGSRTHTCNQPHLYWAKLSVRPGLAKPSYAPHVSLARAGLQGTGSNGALYPDGCYTSPRICLTRSNKVPSSITYLLRCRLHVAGTGQSAASSPQARPRASCIAFPRRVVRACVPRVRAGRACVACVRRLYALDTSACRVNVNNLEFSGNTLYRGIAQSDIRHRMIDSERHKAGHIDSFERLVT